MLRGGRNLLIGYRGKGGNYLLDSGVGFLLSDFDLNMLVFFKLFMFRSYPILAGSPIDLSVKI